MLLPLIQASKLKAKAHSIQAKSVSAKVDALCAAIKGTDTGGGDSDCSEYMVTVTVAVMVMAMVSPIQESAT